MLIVQLTDEDKRLVVAMRSQLGLGIEVCGGEGAMALETRHVRPFLRHLFALVVLHDHDPETVMALARKVLDAKPAGASA